MDVRTQARRIRLLAYKHGDTVHLLSRNRLSLTAAHPDVARAIAHLPVRDVILDGEATGAWGRQGRADYHVFDVLWLDGVDCTPLPLTARRAVLDGLLPSACRSRPPADRRRTSSTRACREGWRASSPSASTRPTSTAAPRRCLKMKCEATQELVIGGFTDPKGSRVGLGALLVGYFDGAFVFAGKVGTGFDAALLRDLRQRLDRSNSRPRRSPAGPDSRSSAPTGAWARHQVDRSPSPSGRCTASCATRACSACGSTRTRPASHGSAPHDHASRQGAVPRRWHHQGSWPPTTTRWRRSC
ncbi:MAG: hypothetical protein R2712_11540 [Vicinamibacterales bacterium]